MEEAQQGGAEKDPFKIKNHNNTYDFFMLKNA